MQPLTSHSTCLCRDFFRLRRRGVVRCCCFSTFPFDLPVPRLFRNSTRYLMATTIAAAMLSTSCTARARTLAEAISGELVLRGVNVLAMDTDSALLNQDVWIRGGRIAAVAPSSSRDAPAAHNIQLQGQWVLPGLWDMHVHVLNSTDTARVARTLRTMMSYSVLGVRDLGSLPDSARTLLAQLSGRRDIPTLTWAGPLLDGRKFQWSQSVAWHITTESEAVAAVDSLAQLGVDWLKLYGSLGAREFHAVMQRARVLGKPVAGHLPQGVSATAAAAAGLRSLEHIGFDIVAGCTANGPARVGRVLSRWVSDGYAGRYNEMESLWAARDTVACASQARTIATNGMFVTPTLVLEIKDTTNWRPPALELLDSASAGYCNGTLASIEMAAPATRERIFQYLLNDVKQLSALGVRLLAGTDLGNPCITPGASLIQELRLMLRAGVAPMEVLRSATRYPALARDGHDRTNGRVATGNEAELVVVAHDPRRNLETLAAPLGVVHRGAWVPGDSLRAHRQR